MPHTARLLWSAKDYQIKGNYMDVARRAEMRNPCKLLVRKSGRSRRPLVTIRWACVHAFVWLGSVCCFPQVVCVNEWTLRIWIVFFWLGMAYNVVLLWTRQWVFGFLKMWRISCLAERPLTFLKKDSAPRSHLRTSKVHHCLSLSHFTEPYTEPDKSSLQHCNSVYLYIRSSIWAMQMCFSLKT
jgi:hypothetical protein